MDYLDKYIENKQSYLNLKSGGAGLKVVAQEVQNWINSRRDKHLRVRDLKKLQNTKVVIFDRFDGQMKDYKSDERVEPKKFFAPNVAIITYDGDMSWTIERGSKVIEDQPVQVESDKSIKKEKDQRIKFNNVPMMLWKEVKKDGMKVYWSHRHMQIQKRLER